MLAFSLEFVAVGWYENKKLYENETLTLFYGCRERVKNHFDRECKKRW
jgi:Uri superfamily endonuclease